jgi:hypothetical protein
LLIQKKIISKLDRLETWDDKTVSYNGVILNESLPCDDDCLSISLAAVSVGVILFTPIAGAMLAIPLMTNFTLPTGIIEI